MPYSQTVVELEELRARLRQADEALAAINNGDAASLLSRNRELTATVDHLRGSLEELKQQNARLAGARAAADAANRAKDDFMAALSHELRTPLTPVLLSVASLEQNPRLDPEVRQELAMLRRNIELESRLIDDLLDLTRITHGKLELREELVDVHAVLDRAVAIARADLAEKQQRLVLDLSAARFHVRGDPVRIQQILWNLLRNAIKFTADRGEITVHSADDGDRIVLKVTDTGIGIEPDMIDRIFTPFEQADPLITRRYGGLGLGLAISKRLAELHDGMLTARSDGHDRGATFTLTLRSVTVPAESPSQAGAAAEHRPQADRRWNILLVEDHDDTRRSMAMLLGFQHRVRDVPDMASALAAAAAERFDLVISDLGLPDGSGLELMRELRSRYGVKGICLSGYGMDDDVLRSVEAGFHKHLTKPVDPGKLQTVIAQVLQSS